jgi:hypothetical protein
MIQKQIADSQLKALSGIAADIGQVCLASMVMPFVVPILDRSGFWMLVSGLILAFIFWFFSVWVVRSVDDE